MYPDLKDIILKGPFYLGENKIYRLLKIDDNHKKTHIILTTPLVILSNYCCQFTQNSKSFFYFTNENQVTDSLFLNV